MLNSKGKSTVHFLVWKECAQHLSAVLFCRVRLCNTSWLHLRTGVRHVHVWCCYFRQSLCLLLHRMLVWELVQAIWKDVKIFCRILESFRWFVKTHCNCLIWPTWWLQLFRFYHAVVSVGSRTANFLQGCVDIHCIIDPLVSAHFYVLYCLLSWYCSIEYGDLFF